MRKELSYREIENTIQSITNTYYSYSALESYLTKGADDVGYNDKNIYLSDGWENIEINFKYYLTSDYDVIVYSIKKNSYKYRLVATIEHSY